MYGRASNKQDNPVQGQSSSGWIIWCISSIIGILKLSGRSVLNLDRNCLSCNIGILNIVVLTLGPWMLGLFLRLREIHWQPINHIFWDGTVWRVILLNMLSYSTSHASPHLHWGLSKYLTVQDTRDTPIIPNITELSSGLVTYSPSNHG